MMIRSLARLKVQDLGLAAETLLVVLLKAIPSVLTVRSFATIRNVFVN